MARNSATTGVTLGFIGNGEVDEKTAIPLLEDFLGQFDGDIKAIFPLTEDLFTDSMVAIGNWLYEHECPYEVVVDDAAAKSKGLADWIRDAAKSHKAATVPRMVVNLLEKAENPRLIVLWDDNDGVSEDTAATALGKNIEVLDLANGLEVIQAGEEPAEGGEETSEEAGEGEYEPYTREELEAIDDIEQLKEILETNGLEQPPPRSRKSTYIDIILKAQEEAEEPGEEPQEAPEEGPEGDDEAEIPEDTPAAPERPARTITGNGETVMLSDEDWDGFRDLAEGIVSDVVTVVDEKLANVYAEIKDLRDRMATLGVHVDRALQQGTFNPAVVEGTQHAVPAKPNGGATKVAGARKAAPPREEETGPTEEEIEWAKRIVEEQGGRRGRPSVDLAKARSILKLDVPQPRRPVGRPRKDAMRA